MSVRYFHAAGNYKGRHALNDTVDLTTLLDAVDTSITDALAETDIDASLTAEAAVGLIQDATDAVRAAVAGSVEPSGYNITVSIQNAPTQNQIRLALENIMRNIENSNEFAQG